MSKRTNDRTMAKGVSGSGPTPRATESSSKRASNGVKRPLPQEQGLGGAVSKLARRATADDGDWDEELHRDFVAAIFDIGLRNSSPAIILENMTQKPKSITSERVKSKLQKYRNNKDKSKAEFLENYDAFFQRAKAIDNAGGMPRGMCSTSTLLEVMGSTALLGADAAAFITYAIQKEREAEKAGEGEVSTLSTQLLKKGAMDYVDNFAGSAIPFPVLTETEKSSSLGVSMTFVMGLFLSMTQHIMQEREGGTGGNPAPGSATGTNGEISSNATSDIALKLAAALAMRQENDPISSNSNRVEAANDSKESEGRTEAI